MLILNSQGRTCSPNPSRRWRRKMDLGPLQCVFRNPATFVLCPLPPSPPPRAPRRRRRSLSRPGRLLSPPASRSCFTRSPPCPLSPAATPLTDLAHGNHSAARRRGRRPSDEKRRHALGPADVDQRGPH
eukprot:scaffold10524_cov113-Isochrysis_galbana.AAC.3